MVLVRAATFAVAITLSSSLFSHGVIAQDGAGFGFPAGAPGLFNPVAQPVATPAASPSTPGKSAKSALAGTMDLAPAAEPWSMTSRVHVQQGTGDAYLVFQIDLAKGHYIYSVTPDGSPAPTQITATASPDFQLVDTFSPDVAPIVIENDPVFQRRVEKHKGTVQFFAPIKLSDGVDPETMQLEIVFNGQVCSEGGSCVPVRDHRQFATFAGWFAGGDQQAEQNQSELR